MQIDGISLKNTFKERHEWNTIPVPNKENVRTPVVFIFSIQVKYK